VYSLYIEMQDLVLAHSFFSGSVLERGVRSKKSPADMLVSGLDRSV
jgi:hypothetical protein